MSKSIKERIIEFIKEMPENSTFEEIQYEIHFLQELEKAEKQLEQEITIPHEVVMKKIREKIKRKYD